MFCRLISLTDPALWEEYLHRLPLHEQDPMYAASWYRHFEQQGYGEACCFVAEEDGKVALYPFLKNSISALGYKLKGEYFDIQGAPGYNGIASNTHDPDFAGRFREQFYAWSMSNNIVAEFSRCNPVTVNQSRFSSEALTAVNNVIVVSLQSGDPGEQYDRSARKNISKARREGLAVTVTPGDRIHAEALDAFISIYLDTMERNSADDEYLLEHRFFVNVVRLMQDRIRIYFTQSGDQTIAAEMVVLGETTAYSWLGGTLSEYFPNRPNDILKDFIIRDLATLKLNHYCLGGGLTPDDGIFRYKRSFARNGIRPFHILKQVYHPEVYHDLMQQWRQQYPELTDKYGKRVLAYRSTK